MNKKRYTALKNYLKDIEKEGCPQLIAKCFKKNEEYIVHNNYSIIFIKEKIDDIPIVTEEDNHNLFDYKQIVNIFDDDSKYLKVDFNKVLQTAKSVGYRFKKSELTTDKFKFVLKIEEIHLRMGLIDRAYAIINDNQPAKIIYTTKSTNPIQIQTNIGTAIICPFKCFSNMEKFLKEKIIIEITESDIKILN